MRFGNCLTIGCTAENTPVTPTDPGDGGEDGGGECTCPTCEDAANP